MKPIIYSLLLTAAQTLFAQAQHQVAATYPISFEKAVHAQKADDIRALYANDDVVLNVTMKSDNASQYYFKSTAEKWAKIVETQIPAPYELRISDENFALFGPYAISTARFDEFVGGQHSSDGYDMFSYVKTADGWRIAHMDVTLAQDAANLPEVESSNHNEEALLGLIDNMKDGLNNNDLSLLKFMDVKDQITVHQFRDEKLSSTTKYDRSACAELKASKGLSFDGLSFSKPQFIDGFMAYTSATINQGNIVVTAVNQSGAWYITSLCVNVTL